MCPIRAVTNILPVENYMQIESTILKIHVNTCHILHIHHKMFYYTAAIMLGISVIQNWPFFKKQNVFNLSDTSYCYLSFKNVFVKTECFYM